jgi:hypothetical protein
MPDRQPVPEPIDVIKELREKVFSISPADIGLSPSPEVPNVWGVLMEVGYPEGVATIVVLADGSTSLYLGPGGGEIGLGMYASIQVASARFLATAERYHTKLEPTDSFPYPDIGRVKFYVRTFSGVLFAEEDEEELYNEDHMLADLFYAGHEIVAEYLFIQERGMDAGDPALNAEWKYLDCLMTILAEGPVKTVIVSWKTPVQPLLPLARGNKQLSSWVRLLRFDYDKLDPKEICNTLMEAAGLSRLNPFLKKSYFSIHVKLTDPKADPVSKRFKVEKTSGPAGDFALQVTIDEN